MKIPYPKDPAVLGRATATCVVLKADEGAQAANLYYWHRAQPWLAAVLDAIGGYGDSELSTATEELLADPRSVAGWQRVRDRVAAAAGESGDGTGGITAVTRAAWEAAMRSRLDYQIGARYDRTSRLGQDWLSWPGATRAAGGDPTVQVVIPFRDRSADGTRARNLVACLVALNDQTAARDDYRVTVVESDDTPRWRDTIARHADEYLFAANPGVFNKCWAVNVGVVNTIRPAPAICVLDADALVDRDFIRRNAARFLRQGAGGFLPYRNLFYLDDAASAQAIRQRCLRAEPEAGPEHLRGFLVHRPPGVCVWLRRDIFETVNGMDERFEGWAPEDLDFVLRVQLATAFDQYDDQMLHLHHPSVAQLNAHVPLLSWAPTEPIGRIDRFQAEPLRA